MKTHAGIGFIVIDQVEELFFCIVLRRGLYKKAKRMKRRGQQLGNNRGPYPEFESHISRFVIRN